MLFMEDGIQFETKMGDGSSTNQSIFDKLISAGSRVLTGESLFMTHFTNRGNKKAKVGFSAPYPGTVIPIDLATSRNNELIVQRMGFYVLPSEPSFLFSLTERSVQVWLEVKDSFSKNFRVMEKHSFMQAVRSLKELSTMKHCASTQDVLLLLNRKLILMLKLQEV